MISLKDLIEKINTGDSSDEEPINPKKTSTIRNQPEHRVQNDSQISKTFSQEEIYDVPDEDMQFDDLFPALPCKEEKKINRKKTVGGKNPAERTVPTSKISYAEMLAKKSNKIKISQLFTGNNIKIPFESIQKVHQEFALYRVKMECLYLYWKKTIIEDLTKIYPEKAQMFQEKYPLDLLESGWQRYDNSIKTYVFLEKLFGYIQVLQHIMNRNDLSNLSKRSYEKVLVQMIKYMSHLKNDLSPKYFYHNELLELVEYYRKKVQKLKNENKNDLKNPKDPNDILKMEQIRSIMDKILHEMDTDEADKEHEYVYQISLHPSDRGESYPIGHTDHTNQNIIIRPRGISHFIHLECDGNIMPDYETLLYPEMLPTTLEELEVLFAQRYQEAAENQFTIFGYKKNSLVFNFTLESSETNGQRPKDTTKGVPQDTTKGVPQDTTKGVPKDTTKGVPKDMTKGVPKDTTKGVPKDTTKGVLQDTTKGVPKDMEDTEDDLQIPEGASLVIEGLPERCNYLGSLICRKNYNKDKICLPDWVMGDTPLYTNYTRDPLAIPTIKEYENMDPAIRFQYSYKDTIYDLFTVDYLFNCLLRNDKSNMAINPGMIEQFRNLAIRTSYFKK